MNILGIETSCDETGAAVVRNGKDVLSNVVVSSLHEHAPYGGIIPEIASRRQLEWISPIVAQALKQARLTLKDIHAVAVTEKPGLIGSLLVGISYGRALGLAAQKPYIPVDHIKAHAYASFLRSDKVPKPETKRCRPKLPMIALVVSGGHSNLYYIPHFKKYKLIGYTLDDAAGEAFDKVAKILSLGYPGGPAIQAAARNSRKDTIIRFKCGGSKENFNFSFSGIKTAVLYYQRDFGQAADFKKEDVADAFQTSLVADLVQKSIKACLKHRTETLVVGGGVAANTLLRKSLQQAAEKQGIHVFFPDKKFCTDNAAMIAGLAYHYQSQ